MKNIRFLMFVLTIGTLLLSACGAAAATPPAGSGKVEAMPVAFVGIVDSIAGDQWVISGTTVTVDPSVVRDGPFAVGAQVKVEGVVNPDGSFTVSRIEAPTPQDVTALPPFGNDNSNDANINDDNANINDANINDDNGNDANINDDNGNSTNANDDNSNAGGPGNTNDDNGGGGGGGGNDNGGGGGGGNDNGGGGGGGGNDNGGGGGGHG
jgi:uncharacterized membrane protein YgcG